MLLTVSNDFVIITEGPQFSTRAESNMYRSWGGTVINMSTLPEAKLAAEAEIAYQVILMSTDYDVSAATSTYPSIQPLLDLTTKKPLYTKSHLPNDRCTVLLHPLTRSYPSAGTSPATSRSKWSWAICAPTH